MSLRKILQDNGITLLTIDEIFDLAYLTDKEICSYGAVTGHLGYRFLQRYPGAYTFCFLRDPVERIKSMFCFWRQIQKNLPLSLIETSKVFRDFVKSPSEGIGIEMDNGMAWQIACDRTYRMRALHPNITNESLLAVAKDNLLRLDYVGFQESFTEDLDILCNKLELSYENVPRENKTLDKSLDIDPESLDIVKQRMALDIELYAFAKEWAQRGLWKNK